MSTYTFSPKQTRLLEITCLVVFVATIIFGVLYQIMGWKLQGGHLVLVCILVINYVNLMRSHLAQANARIDVLEKRLTSPLGP